MKKQIATFLIIIGLVFLLISADFNNMYINLKKIPLSTFAFLITLQIITIFLLAYQWKNTMMLVDIKKSFLTVLKMNLKGNIIDSITPGSKVGGEVIRVVDIKNNLNINTHMSVLILIIQKMISLFSFILLSIVSILYLGNFYKVFNYKKVY
ncbi:MAG TPA: lysylphosphatidylglycerol synthase domain-containing protein, partial [Tissierellaceae bacterium]